MTFTAGAPAGTPVGPGVGTVCSPSPGAGGAGGAGVAGEVRETEDLKTRVPDPHPAASSPIVMTATNEAR
jgi:hypothetical protein